MWNLIFVVDVGSKLYLDLGLYYYIILYYYLDYIHIIEQKIIQ
jgi:hypothetical protein